VPVLSSPCALAVPVSLLEPSLRWGGLLMVTAVLTDAVRLEASAPSLVTITDNSTGQDRDNSERYCLNGRWVQGECVQHGQLRWVLAPCKRRDCEVCGSKGRYEIAKRIAYGVRYHWPCSWHTLTFDTYEAEESEWKPKAVQKLGKYIAWLRKFYPGCQYPVWDIRWDGSGWVVVKKHPGLQYAATYELTQRGRLHINLIIGPWRYIPQRTLQKWWGAQMWVERVKDSESVGRETAKSYSPESLGKYLAKLEQSVPEEWGRRVSFSKGWPKLPKEPVERKGEITWRQEWELEQVDVARFQVEKEHGWWREVAVGEWQPLLLPHDCSCFDLVVPDV